MLEGIIIVIGLIIDRVTKLWAMGDNVKAGIDVIEGFFTFEYLENRGAAFGIFQDKLFFLAIFTAIVVIGLIVFIIKKKPKHLVLRTSLALIIGGALGNLYDRVVYKFVVDFIQVHYKDIYYFPTFNVADMLVVVGTFLLAICIIREWE